MLNQKGLSQAFIIILVALLTAGVAGGGVWWWQEQQKDEMSMNYQKMMDGMNKSAMESSKKESASTKESKDETADWETYSNKDFAISFKYPKTYTLKETGSFKVGAENAGTLTLTDKTRKGEPTLSIMFNPFGIGGCMTSKGDISYTKSSVKNNKLELNNKIVETSDDCGESDKRKIYFWVLAANSFSNGKNELFANFNYDINEDYEDEFDKIIDTFTISDESLYK